MHIASNLKRLRTEAGLTQEQLAEASGITRPHIGNIEAGAYTNITTDTLELLAKGLSCSVADLVSEPKRRSSKSAA